MIARCAHESCKKKLKLTDWECRCGKRFCAIHRALEKHNCESLKKNNSKENNGAAANAKDRADMMRCVSDKLGDRL